MARAEPGQLRIIGGRWRGRRLPVPAVAGLRPTPDRVRETLFNWLAPVIDGSRCLDCFAGSGALGIEAASRGAREVVMIERDAGVARVLGENRDRLGAEQVRIVVGDALAWLAREPPRPFDIVFLDPPFRTGLLADVPGLLAAPCGGDGGWLAPSALIYLELGRDEPLPALPPGWEVRRDRAAGQVRYLLVGTPGNG